MSGHTIEFHRVLRAPAERVWRAFTDAQALAKWLPPHGFTGQVQQLDVRVGGSYRMSFTQLSNGQVHAFGGDYLEVRPHERLRYSDRFDDPALAGQMVTTVSFRVVSAGTELHVVQEGVPEVVPREACCLGWQESLSLLALLVEAEVPG